MKTQKPKRTATSFKLPPDIIAALGKAAEKLSRQHHMGPSWSRTDALIYFIKRGLSELNAEYEDRPR